MVNSVMCRAGNRRLYKLSAALQEAARDGYDEALLDNEGMIVGFRRNIFIIKGGNIYTPELSSALRHYQDHHHFDR